MSDPVDPIPPVSTPIPEPAPASTASSTGLPSNVAAALACIPLIGGIIFFILEKRDSFVRFYAMQSIIFGGAWVLFVFAWEVMYRLFVPIPAVGWIFGFILWVLWVGISIAALIMWIIAMVKAFTGVRWDIPYVGPIARQQVGTTGI